MYYGCRMLRICSQSQLLGLEALKAHAQLANHTLCMVVVLLLHSGEVGNVTLPVRLLCLCRRKCALFELQALGASSRLCCNAMCLLGPEPLP